MPGPIVFVPSTAAPTHPGRFRGDASAGDRAVRTATSPPPGGPFLPDVFMAGGQSLWAAFGADPSASPAEWVWTDITTPYVQWTPGIFIQIGAFSGSALRFTPSYLTAVLRNDQVGGGDFTLENALGVFHPYVIENVPIRAWLDVGNGAVDRFVGYATSWAPTRGPGGEAFVMLTAHGAGRRIQQGKAAKFSALRKSYGRANVDAYWHLEQGAGATVGASAVATVPDMRVTAGAVSFGTAEDSLPASLALAQFSKDDVGGQLTGVIPALFTAAVLGSARWSVEFVIKAPALQPGASISVMNWYVQGTIDLWNITVKPVADGGLILGFINTTGGVQSYSSNVAIDDGEWHQVRVDCTQTTGPHMVTYLDGVSIIDQTTTGTNGIITTVKINPDVDADAAFPALGHLAVWNAARNGEDTLGAFRGHTGETVKVRLERLAAEAGVMLTVDGDAGDLMGPQVAGAFLDLAQDAIAVDGGMLADGLNAGFTYFTRQRSYARSASLTLDSTTEGDLIDRVDGEHSDRDRINVYTARDPFTNADRVSTREGGPLGTALVGTYDTGGDHRVNIPDQLDQIASWITGQGTVPGLRWPKLGFQLAKPSTSRLAQEWLGTLPTDRIDAAGLATGSRPDRSLLLRGWQERWTSRTWRADLSLVSYDGYAITTFADDAGTDGEFLGWLDTDDDVLTASAIAAGATSVVVSTSASGTVLTNPTVATYADDLDGLYISLYGMKIGVTAITAPSGSQQTLTLVGSDVLIAVPTAQPVTAWAPLLPGL